MGTVQGCPSGTSGSVIVRDIYTSSALCKRILTLRFKSCGTVRLDRKGIPPTFNTVTSRRRDLESEVERQAVCLRANDDP